MAKDTDTRYIKIKGYYLLIVYISYLTLNCFDENFHIDTVSGL